MIRFILLLVFLAAAALLGPQLANHQGYVLIAVAGYTVEMSAITAVILAVAFYAVLLLTENLLSRVFGLRRGLRFWLRQRHYVKAQKQTQKGMTALAEGQFRRAETLMSRSAEQSELPLLNYLSAAEAAHAQQSFEKRDTYLQQAEEANPQAQLAIRLTQVRLLQEQGNWEASLVQLQTLHGRFQNNPQVLTRLKIAYEAMQDWESLLALIPALKKQQVISETTANALSQTAYQSLFRDKAANADASAALAFWEKQPRAIRHDRDYVLLFADCLLEKGHSDAATELLLPLIRKSPDEALWLRCQRLQTKGNALQSLLLKQVKNHPQSAPLLSAIGHGYLSQQQWVLAQSYFERSVAIQPTVSDRLALAKIMEQQRLFEKAAEYYRLSLTQAE